MLPPLKPLVPMPFERFRSVISLHSTAKSLFVSLRPLLRVFFPITLTEVLTSNVHNRIKDVRRRARPTAPSGSASSSQPFAPFTSLDPNTVSATPTSQPAFAFGQSQSFPGAGSNPSQATQGASAPFAFGSGSGASSFNFNSFGSSSGASNPFANMNNGGPSQPPSGSGFGGFKGSLFNLPPGGNQAAPSTTGPFGTLQSNPTGGLFGGLGAATTTPASQSAPATAATTSSIFGQPSATTTAGPSTNIFGPSTPVKRSAFGQSSAFGGDTMQTSPDTSTNGAASSVFGVSTNFGGGGAQLFGAGNKTETKPTFSAPAQPVFGTKTAGPSTPSTSLFGAPSSTSQATSVTTTAPAVTTPAATTSAATAATSTLFGNTTPAKAEALVQNPFQASNLFAGTPKATEVKKEAEQKPAESAQAKTPFQFAPSTPSGTSLFSKSASAAPAATSGGLFGTKPAFGTPQPASSASNLFGPKPAAPVDQDASKTAQGNPFSNLFASPATKPAENVPAQDKTQPIQNPFGSLFAPKPSPVAEGPKPSEPPKPATNPLFSASAPKPSNVISAQPPAIYSSVAGPNIQAPVAAHPPAKVNGAELTALSGPITKAPSLTQPAAPGMRFQDLQPQNLFANLDKDLKDDAELLYRVRTLNQAFKDQVTKLDPVTDDFDNLVMFYIRIRETMGAPACLGKRKAREEGSAVDTAVDGDAHTPKRIKPANGSLTAADTTGAKPSTQVSTLGQNGVAAASPAPDMTIAQSSITSTPSKLFGTPSQAPSTSKKRKSADDDDEVAAPSTSPQGKRVKESEESTTASIFAQSFSKSVTSDAGNENATNDVSKTPTSSLFKSSVSDPSKAPSGSTTPTSSPSKPLFSLSAAPKEIPATGSLFSSSASISKPTFSMSTGGGGGAAAPKNPFVLKPTENQTKDPSASTVAGIPKFGSGGATDFLAQFKKQAAETAAKEKAKRKAEDFDSEEEDEAEWERRDAEEQRKKRQEIEALAKNRPKFVPGMGFSFDESTETSTESKGTEQTSAPNASTSSVDTSVFDSKNASIKSNNIFGHLSATPSEAEDDNDGDDTEEASGDEKDDETKDPSFAPVSDGEGSRDVSQTPTPVSATSAALGGNEASVEVETPAKVTESAGAAAPAPSGGRSLFDRIQYNKDGKPKRHEDAKSSDGKDSPKPFSTLLSGSKFASSFNTPGSAAPSVFANTPASTTGSGSLFGSSVNTTGSLFGSPSPAFGSSTASGTTKPAGDNTWKVENPIKFADTITTSASSSKPELGSATPAAVQSKPFSTLFGGSSTASKPATGTPQQPLFGFGFGGPSQQAASALAPPTIASTAPSRSTTPGITSDTPADESAQGDAAEPLPQVDLARSNAGEEDEDLVLETRARGLKFESQEGWVSKGIGYLRILKHRTTSRSRVILRADPSGKVVLNAALLKAIEYKVSTNSVQFLVPQPTGAPEQWAIRVKKEEVDRLASAIEECKN